MHIYSSLSTYTDVLKILERRMTNTIKASQALKFSICVIVYED